MLNTFSTLLTGLVLCSLVPSSLAAPSQRDEQIKGLPQPESYALKTLSDKPKIGQFWELDQSRFTSNFHLVANPPKYEILVLGFPERKWFTGGLVETCADDLEGPLVQGDDHGIPGYYFLGKADFPESLLLKQTRYPIGEDKAVALSRALDELKGARGGSDQFNRLDQRLWSDTKVEYKIGQFWTMHSTLVSVYFETLNYYRDMTIVILAEPPEGEGRHFLYVAVVYGDGDTKPVARLPGHNYEMRGYHISKGSIKKENLSAGQLLSRKPLDEAVAKRALQDLDDLEANLEASYQDVSNVTDDYISKPCCPCC